MRKILINGNKRLAGEVRISGSKNAALAILAATILLPGKTIIRNVPDLLDIKTIIRVLQRLGLRAEYSASQENTVEIWNRGVKHVAPYELVTKMRASFFVIGPILARQGLAKIPLPGGCAIGSRPVNLHIKGLEALGAKVRIEHGFVIAEAAGLKGDRVYLDFPSVGATESVMMAAALAAGETIIENAAGEPEIVDLANFLNLAGAKITGAGTEEIRIQGVKELSPVEYRVIPDRIEAGTFILAVAITKGEALIRDIVPEHIESVVRKLKETGLEIEMLAKDLRVSAKNGFKAVDLKTMPHPGFPTDMQPQFCSFLSLAQGTSVITETVFENRFMCVHELRRMGAEIKLEGQSAIITGVPELSSAPIKVSDLRAGAALVIAGLAAKGETLIEDRDHHIERGYEKLIYKLRSLGADIKEV
ncbi:UDP-N-acetylglucosamine 1-carboxyvinyltransferase [candidate division WOR-1 bacterium RIFOXYB2_FULL_42_35]|uniref:UDP-N-acetylglucosamine 1-carboxyvinyltransferase n=1 Tax=candidate division WOR-1 bacterium RIFOXYC2_FULL_41_25 TaxID=1802586 RepID=A0A1F4TQB4_UNCSA|nr:MAG: UDP-N-acetylglucosamine 1-carboxyvinyltransferase [candidate division WOR-1 bacterium RIFOXYA2_FULL_41_14]OGC25462.1 MAG: UDP-N-acetylglucosamine 1-carboxyvinyltransferase [candidate division WOR-1 bacterium RIFOXYB2_FULL_42_35]OGC34868.1 MAG: UDP-N-acetylglucosamine 1-carboxyvinyltransferase [candidate division WOR-1 bacterium RIFOXYC2_FULL_41_25]